MMQNKQRQALDDAINALYAESLVFGKRFIQDGRVRVQYKMQTKRFADEILRKVEQGVMTPQEGAEQASAMRNQIMETMRLNSSDVGRAIAKVYKKRGLTLPDLKDKYARSEYSSDFEKLTAEQKKGVWMEIIDASKRPNQTFNKFTKITSRAGKGLVLLTAGIAVYKILKAKNKLKETVKQAAVLSSTYVGGEIGGAIGALGGPFDPITIPLGVFLGGLLGNWLGTKASQ